jgi:hypothetical protein
MVINLKLFSNFQFIGSNYTYYRLNLHNILHYNKLCIIFVTLSLNLFQFKTIPITLRLKKGSELLLNILRDLEYIDEKIVSSL